MATSTVKSGLDGIASGISTNQARVAQAVELLSAADDDLGEYAERYADLIAEINAFAPDGAFETLAKNELALLTTEFGALRSQVQAAIAELS